MPIRIDKKLPAVEILRTENIFVMDDQRAAHQDIRPLKILILNLMPQKMVTETQLLRHLANTPLQLDIDFLYMESHRSKTTRSEHMETFYKTFPEVKDEYFDGMIITGAPVEHLPFEEVDLGGIQSGNRVVQDPRLFDASYLLGCSGWSLSALWGGKIPDGQ